MAAPGSKGNRAAEPAPPGATPPRRPLEAQLFVLDNWADFALLDSGDGRKLERYGPVVVIRPEPQALWRPALPPSAWTAADAVFEPAGVEEVEEGGGWRLARALPESWPLSRGRLAFRARLTPFRHLGLFPEQATQWDWCAREVAGMAPGSAAGAAPGNAPRVLNLFGYTGLASLACAAAGAEVTHVDASRKAITLARENQAEAGLEHAPIRWIVDDALKFLRREARRGSRYHGVILDPPKFGRGPKGEVWKLFEALPELLELTGQVLAPEARFVVLTAYAIRASALALGQALAEALPPGRLACGELALQEESAGRLVPTALIARWAGPAPDAGAPAGDGRMP